MTYQFYNTITGELDRKRGETERPYTLDGKPGPMPDGVVELRVVREALPEVSDGEALEPVEGLDVKARTLTYGWRVVDAPPERVPESITAYQLGQYLTSKQYAAVQATINGMPKDTEEEKEVKHKAAMAWLKATVIRRDDALVPVLALAAGYDTPEKIDQAFREASKI